MLLLKAMFKAALFGIFLINVCTGYAGDNDYFAARRSALMAQIGESVAVLQGVTDTRAYATFRQDNNFYYLTGVTVPDALLLLDGARRESVLFLPSENKEQENWEAPHLAAGREARRITGIDKVIELEEFSSELKKRVEPSNIVYTPFMPYETAATSRDRALQHDWKLTENSWDGREARESAFRKKLTQALGESTAIKNLSPVLDGMRRIKDAMEIERLRTAGRIGALGLREAIRSVKPGMYEYQLAAVAKFVYLWHGAFGEGYFPIVGSGPNSCILHYHRNQRRMEAGDIVLMDFGPDYGYYVSDVTRTFPVAGKFSDDQAKVYTAVLEAWKAVIDTVRPGVSFTDLDEAAREVLERYGYDKYFLHAVSHYVGMSVHDNGDAVPFEPGVVIAVEPGVYIPDKNLGIRIEDTVLVTEDGCEILTPGVPREMVEIEKLMSSGSIAIEVGN